MDFDELERVLEFVAEMVDKKKSDLIKCAEPEEDMPTAVLADYSKGELVAELTFLNFIGFWRKRTSWYGR